VSDDEVQTWVAIEAATFECKADGLTYTIVPGTTFSAGHPVVAERRSMFRPFRPDYEWGAPRNTSSAATRGARTR
jgi:hypothetical protein